MSRKICLSVKALATGVALTALCSVASANEHERLLHVFQGGTDGAAPAGALLADQTGNLYGVTEYGGAYGEGTVYKVAPHGAYTVLYSFGGYQGDGAAPSGNLVFDSQGNLYGTTLGGGSNPCFQGTCGTVFKLAPDGTETLLYSFKGYEFGDGMEPAGLAIDAQGNLYGSAEAGAGCVADFGCGALYEVTPNGTETVLYSFQDGADGEFPQGPLVMDSSGNLYGEAALSGADRSGTVFELAPNGTLTTLYAFTGYQNTGDGWQPMGGLTFDSQGNLYGTTQYGGSSDIGTVFELTPNGTETVLYSFGGNANDAVEPTGGVIRDASGNLFGTTTYGGNTCINHRSCGTVFEVAPNGAETVLWDFQLRKTGWAPVPGLIEDSSGNLYGTTVVDGDPIRSGTPGVVFSLSSQPPFSHTNP